eukprot:jgi/Psemu1/287828/fgenesh1_pg.216_\
MTACKTKKRCMKRKTHLTLTPRIEPFRREIGLKTSKFNGKTGIIASLPDPSNVNRYGVRVKGTRKPIGIKHENMKAVAKTMQELKKEYGDMRRLEECPEEERLGADQMQMMRMMMNMFMTEERQIKAFGRKINPLPNFCLEMIREGGGFPKGINHSWADSYLRTVYEQECALSHMNELVLKSPNYKVTARDLLKRLRCNSKLEWYRSSEEGDVFKRLYSSTCKLLQIQL